MSLCLVFQKRIASLKKTLLPEPPIGAEGRILIAIDLERNGRFKRFWLKTNKFKDLFHWVVFNDFHTLFSRNFSFVFQQLTNPIFRLNVWTL